VRQHGQQARAGDPQRRDPDRGVHQQRLGPRPQRPASHRRQPARPRGGVRRRRGANRGEARRRQGQQDPRHAACQEGGRDPRPSVGRVGEGRDQEPLQGPRLAEDQHLVKKKEKSGRAGRI